MTTGRPVDPLLDVLACHPPPPGVSWTTPPETRLPSEPLPEHRWRPLLGAVRAGRLEGQLAAAVDAGSLPVAENQRAEAARAHQRAMALTLLLEAELIELHDELRAAGIAHRVLKGPAVAHLDELDPAWRAFGDLDLLVAGTDLEQAGRIVTGRGGRRRFPEPAPGFDRRFSKGVSYAFERKVEVDLHRTLALGPFGLTLSPASMLDRKPDGVPIGTRIVPALDRTDRFLHAALHAVLGDDPPRPRALRDVVLLAPVTEGAVRAAVGRAGAGGIAAPVAAAVRVAGRRLGWRPPALLGAWAAHRHPDRRERRWLAAYRGPTSSSARRSVLALEALPGRLDRLSYASVVLHRRAAAPGRPSTRTGRALAAIRPGAR